jgi:hypothetical protein
MDETLQMNPQVCGRSATAQLKPKDSFGARSIPAKQRYEYNSIMNTTRVGCPGARINTGFAGFLVQQQ